MTPPIPQNSKSSLAGTTDFDKYEDFILEEYMDMTCGNAEQPKSSGLAHPSHFNGIPSDDKSFFKRSFGTNSATETSREPGCSRNEVFDQHRGSILKTLPTYRRNNPPADSPGLQNVKTVHASLTEQTSTEPHKNYVYQNLFNLEECGIFEMLNRANKEQRTSKIPTRSSLNSDQGILDSSVQVDLVDVEQKRYSEGSSDFSGEGCFPEVTKQTSSCQLSSSNWWKTIDLDSSSEALTDSYHEIQHRKPEDPKLTWQNAQNLKPLTIGIPSYALGPEEMRFISSDDSVSDTLVIDEWREKDDQRPSVIVQSPSGVPIESLQHHSAAPSTEQRMIDQENTRGGLQPQQAWPATTCYPGQQFANFTQALGRGNEVNGIKYNWSVENKNLPKNTAAWGYHSIQDSSVIDQRSIRIDESAQCGSLHHRDTIDDGVQSHASSTDRYQQVPGSCLNPEQIAASHLSQSRDAMWSQSNYVTTIDDGARGGFHDHTIQRLATNFAHLNQLTTREIAQAPDREMTSNDTAFEALASIGLFPYPCNDPTCPGDISRRFQEFPFPRRKSTSRNLSNHNQISPMPTSSGSESILSEMFEVEPNQDEQRLLLRRMRNREAAKRCRKKKKQEFIALLFKRAMLLADYHRCYHTYHQNIP